MPEAVKKYLDRIKEFWNKYSRRQQMIFISAVLVVIIFFVILGVVLAKPQRTVVRYCENANEAVEVRELLSSNGIECEVGSDYSITINPADEIEAQLILGSNNISSEGYSIKDAISGSFTQTEADTEKLYTDFLQKKFASNLKKIDGIKDAVVTVRFSDNGNTIFTSEEDAMINAILTTTRELDSETIEGIAMLLASNVGSDNTNNVVIMDNSGRLLFSGSMNSGSGSLNISTLEKYKTSLKNSIESGIRNSVIVTQTFSDVRVEANIALTDSIVSEVTHEYSAPTGTEEGLWSSSYEVNSEGGSGASGVAGVESNDDDTTYPITNGNGTQTKYSLKQYEWLQDEHIVTSEKAAGTLIPEQSGLAITLVRYNIVREEDLRAQGVLDNMTFDEYMSQNSEPVRVDVDPDFLPLWSAGSGIPEANIAVIGYQVNQFIPISEDDGPDYAFIIQIVLAVLIVGLLAFVVFRSARPVTVSETEPELSVEEMLSSTREKQTVLEEIDLHDKSEARKAIEKFVMENPEAVALLLRNWINEGWS